jgi:hypothetical protein
MSSTYLQDLITIKNSSYSFRYQNKPVIPQVRTTHLRLAGAKLWNELPNCFRKETSLN